MACGSFAPRPTPTASPQPTTTYVAPAALAPTATPTVLLQIIELTPTPAPTATETPAPQADGLQSGARALVTAPAGLNMRAQPTSNSQLIVRLGSGVRVTVVDRKSVV